MPLSRKNTCGRIRTIIIFTVLAGFIVLIFTILLVLMKDPPGITAGIKDSQLTYLPIPPTLEMTGAGAKSLLPTDARSADPYNKQDLLDEFEDLYIKKGVLTDCSFTAAFMLMYEHDTDYPYKVLQSNTDGNYIVNFPGHEKELPVTSDDIARFDTYIRERSSWRSYFRESHTVPGIDIMRNAYYKHTTKTKNSRIYRVYGGGIPINDLLMLSGVGIGHVIGTVHEESGSAFSEDKEVLVEVTLQDGVISRAVKVLPKEYGNPLSGLGDLSKYMIALSSSKVLDNSSGTNIIAGHAYYLKGVTADGLYVLGNSYNTKNVVVIDESELLRKFASIHYIQIYAAQN